MAGMGTVVAMGSVPGVPCWGERRKAGGEAKYLPARLARCLPPPAMLWLFLRKDGGAGTEHRRGGCVLTGGGWGAPISQPLHPSWGMQAGPRGGRGMICSSGTRGAGVSPAAPRGVLGRSGQGGKGDGGRSGHRWVFSPAGSGRRRVASPVTSPRHGCGLLVGLSPREAQPRKGPELPSAKPSWVLGTKATLEALDAPNRHRQEPELSLPPCPGQLGTLRQCHPQGGDTDPQEVPAAWWGCTGSPWASQGLARTRAAGWARRPSRRPWQASPVAAPRCASLARTQRPAPAAKARRFPSPGEELGKDPAAQVRQRSRAGGRAGQPLPRIDFSVNSPLL